MWYWHHWKCRFCCGWNVWKCWSRWRLNLRRTPGCFGPQRVQTPSSRGSTNHNQFTSEIKGDCCRQCWEVSYPSNRITVDSVLITFLNSNNCWWELAVFSFQQNSRHRATNSTQAVWHLDTLVLYQTLFCGGKQRQHSACTKQVLETTMKKQQK